MSDTHHQNWEVTGRILREMLDSVIFYSISRSVLANIDTTASTQTTLRHFIKSNIDCSESTRQSLHNIAAFFMDISLESGWAIFEYLQSKNILTNNPYAVVSQGLKLLTTRATTLSTYTQLCIDAPLEQRIKCALATQPYLPLENLSIYLLQQFTNYFKASPNATIDYMGGVEKMISRQVVDKYQSQKDFLFEQCSALVKSIN